MLPCHVWSLGKTAVLNDSPLLSSPDPAYQQHVPNLDGGDGHSEHIIFGTNLDLTESPGGEGGQGEGGGESTPEATSSTAEGTTGRSTDKAKL